MSLLNNDWIVIITVIVGILALIAIIRSQFKFSLAGKTVLLTGGSRGLGLIMARQLVEQGAKLAICARHEGNLERARKELVERGGDVLAVRCDVTDKQQVDQMVEKVRSRFGKIDLLINNAGMITVAPMEEMTIEDYDAAMKLHFWATLYTTLAVLPEMRERKEGRIVNISSIGGKVTAPHLLPYCTSKFALTGFSEGLRAELAKDGIVVTTVCPGLIRTGSPYNANFKGQHRAEFTWFTLSDSLPIISMSADRAARQIIAACRRGDAEIITSLTALLAAKFYAIFPGITASILALVNRFLPQPGGIGTNIAKGKDSTSNLAPSDLTAVSDKAAYQNNQF